METKCVIIPQTLQNETLATSRKRGVKAFDTVETKKSLLELTIESNSILSDKLMVIGQLTNFKDSRNILLKLGIYNYEEIIEACSKNTAADFAFAAFESKADDILVVTTSLPPAIANDYYYNTIEHAKKMAAGGDLVLIDFHKEEYPIESQENEAHEYRIYCFKASSYLNELLEYEPVIYYSARRAHFKKSGSFINELLNDLIPSQSVEEAVIEKSNKVKFIRANFSDMYYPTKRKTDGNRITA